MSITHFLEEDQSIIDVNQHSNIINIVISVEWIVDINQHINIR